MAADGVAHIVMKVANRADMDRTVSLMADARQHPLGHVDLLTMGRDYTGSCRTWLVRVTPDEAEQYAANILEIARVARAATIVGIQLPDASDAKEDANG